MVLPLPERHRPEPHSASPPRTAPSSASLRFFPSASWPSPLLPAVARGFPQPPPGRRRCLVLPVGQCPRTAASTSPSSEGWAAGARLLCRGWTGASAPPPSRGWCRRGSRGGEGGLTPHSDSVEALSGAVTHSSPPHALRKGHSSPHFMDEHTGGQRKLQVGARGAGRLRFAALACACHRGRAMDCCPGPGPSPSPLRLRKTRGWSSTSVRELGGTAEARGGISRIRRGLPAWTAGENQAE